MDIVVDILVITGGLFVGYKLCQLQNKFKKQPIHNLKTENLENTPDKGKQEEIKTLSKIETLEKSFIENKNKTLIIENGKFVPKDYNKLFLSSDYKESTLKKQVEKIKEYMTIANILEQDLEEYLVLVGLYEGRQDELETFRKTKNVYLEYLEDRLKRVTALYNNVKNGRLGEEYVWDVINKFDNCLCLKDKRLEFTDDDGVHSIQMDSILISSKGLFILEVKNVASEGQYEIKIDKTGVWRAIYPNGKEYVMEQNANKQNNRHLIYLNKLINQSLGTSDERYIEAKGITVIGNNKVKVENLSENQVVLCADEIYNYINKFNMVYNDTQKQYLHNFINKHHKTKPKRHPVVNWITEVENIGGMMITDLQELSDDITVLENKAI